jgi:hypothetical protein
MAKKKKKGEQRKERRVEFRQWHRRRTRNGGERKFPKSAPREPRLHAETRNSIWAVSFICVAAVLVLAWFSIAGPAGAAIYSGLDALLGWGYLILPATLLFAAAVFLLSRQKRILATTLIGSTLLILSVLGLIELLSPGHGGWLGSYSDRSEARSASSPPSTIDIFILDHLRTCDGERADQSGTGRGMTRMKRTDDEEDMPAARDRRG